MYESFACGILRGTCYSFVLIPFSSALLECKYPLGFIRSYPQYSTPYLAVELFSSTKRDNQI